MASSLQNLDAMNGNDDPNLALSISNLNRSLNLSETPGVRVLDAALSLMCYTGPQVCSEPSNLIDIQLDEVMQFLFCGFGCCCAFLGL